MGITYAVFGEETANRGKRVETFAYCPRVPPFRCFGLDILGAQVKSKCCVSAMRESGYMDARPTISADMTHSIVNRDVTAPFADDHCDFH